MQLKFLSRHKSIDTFSDVLVEDFSVFTWKNGSGKTHLLSSIKEGKVQIDDISPTQISYFNFQSFLIRNQKSVSPRNIDDEKTQAWQILRNDIGTFQSYDTQIKGIISEVDFPYGQIIDNQTYNDYIKHIITRISQLTNNNPKIRKLLKTAVFESWKFASEMSEKDFMKHSNYSPDDYELLESLSEIFIDFQKRLIISWLPKTQGGEWLGKKDIANKLKQAPWNFINEMFREFSLPHLISSPDFTAADLIGSQSVSFQVKLNIDDQEIDFEDLSSGEKILCSLAMTVYQDTKSNFPRVLLLDEVDASLHPSMIQNLLSVIANVFIKNGCKVILVTHSPTTVALINESSLFQVQKGKILNKIVRISKDEAISILSEGYMTIERWLKIFDALFKKDLTVISEWKNQQHIKKAIELLDKNLLGKIQFYEHDSGSGDADLCGLFEFIKKADIQKKVLFVWDCDSKGKVSSKVDTDRVFRFWFEKNTLNALCGRGIENLFPETIFTDDVVTIVNPNMVNWVSRGEITKNFNDANKNAFLEKIKNETDLSVFTNFSPLIEKIKSLAS